MYLPTYLFIYAPIYFSIYCIPHYILNESYHPSHHRNDFSPKCVYVSSIVPICIQLSMNINPHPTCILKNYLICILLHLSVFQLRFVRTLNQNVWDHTQNIKIRKETIKPQLKN